MIYDIQLSQHFKLSEFTHSDTANRRGIDNTPSLDVVSNLQYLCIHGLEPLREYANQIRTEGSGERGISISSGYRCKALNAAVGGAAQSNHLYGCAADIKLPDNATGMRWFEWMRTNLQYDELIVERVAATSATFWIHLAIRQDQPNRMRVVKDMVKRK